MREQVYAALRPDGGVPFRQGGDAIACDAQTGEVLESYREYLTSVDGKWLDAHWPSIKKMMEYAINTWDKDEDGVLAGTQHNTLDCNLGGSTSWLGSMYLAALKAAARMAEIEKDPETAARCMRIFESGAKKQNETLFNGEYYIQIPDPAPLHDYNNGCHIDQVLGQWWANQLDLGTIYPQDRVQSALRALLKYNFRDSLKGVLQAPRKFADDNDAGMQMIQWPNMDRPTPFTLYADEVMSGFEYAAAATMIQSGMPDEGLMVVKAAADRYDGRVRTGLTPGDFASWGYSGNPFGDDECGKYYARAMSIWSVLLACQGFVYDGPAGRIGFKPVTDAARNSFFSTAEGWGTLQQDPFAEGKQLTRLNLTYGKLDIRSIVLQLPTGTQPDALTAEVTLESGKPLKASIAGTAAKSEIVVEIDPLTLKAGETLTVKLVAKAQK
jgi:hypothetical protein